MLWKPLEVCMSLVQLPDAGGVVGEAGYPLHEVVEDSQQGLQLLLCPGAGKVDELLDGVVGGGGW